MRINSRRALAISQELDFPLRMMKEDSSSSDVPSFLIKTKLKVSDAIEIDMVEAFEKAEPAMYSIF
jgi:serine protease inhibitor